MPAEKSLARDMTGVVEEMLKFRDEHGPVRGDDLTIREMIAEGRP